METAAIIPIRPAYLEGVDPNVEPYHGLPECEALLEEIATIERGRDRIVEENRETLDRITELERAVRAAEVDLLLEGAGAKEKLHKAMVDLAAVKEVHRNILNQIATGDAAIEQRKALLPSTRMKERSRVINEARLRERPSLAEFEEKAREALVELTVRRALDLGISPGAVDFAKVAATLTIERPIREICWNRYVELVGCQPL